jgi:hypothetical protein
VAGSGQPGKYTFTGHHDFMAFGLIVMQARMYSPLSPTGIDSFADHGDTLATWYKPGEESAFVSAVGLVWGGIPYTNRFAGAIDLRRYGRDEVAPLAEAKKPMSLTALVGALHLNTPAELTEIVEPCLMYRRWIAITSKGREITRDGLDMLRYIEDFERQRSER